MVKRQRIARKPPTPPAAADAWVSSGGLDPETSQAPKAEPSAAPTPPAIPTPLEEKGKAYPHRISFDMETPQYKRLKRASFEEERPMNEILRDAVEAWLKTRDY